MLLGSSARRLIQSIHKVIILHREPEQLCFLMPFPPVLSDIAIIQNRCQTHLLLSHINYATNAIPLLHGVKSRIDLWKRLPVSDELIDLELALHVIVHQVWELGAALDSAKSTSLRKQVVRKVSGHKKKRTYLPNTACNELECCSMLATETSSVTG
jgi:hypothetical protein